MDIMKAGLVLAAVHGIGAVRIATDNNGTLEGVESYKVLQGADLPALRFMSFNLEGRGGNQATKEGQERRVNLNNYFKEVCKWSKPPDVILTQEDITAELPGNCYTTIASCASEDYWWTETEKFGDGDLGNHMQNKIYVHKSGALAQIPPTEAGEIPLTDEKMVSDGLNPRCMAYAKYNLGGKEMMMGSFHLSGGYVDDAAVSNLVKARQLHQADKQYMMKLRELQITAMMKDQASAAGTYIFGGDTNGFPKAQIDPCQHYRIHNFLLPEWLKGGAAPPAQAEQQSMITGFQAYLTLPDRVGSLTRVNAELKQAFGSDHFVVNDDGTDICKSSVKSTTKWGGQPDQFYTNAKKSRVWVEGEIGLGPRGAIPFPCVLSDHNPVMFSVDLS